MQEELYGSAAADVHAEEVEEEAGRWRRVPLHKIPNALAIPRAVQLEPATTATHHLEGGGAPIVVTDAQEGWKAKELWSFGYLRQEYGEHSIFCTDRAPQRKKDNPQAQTLRVKLADYCDYTMGVEESYISAYERPSPSQGGVFYMNGWSPFYQERELASHFSRPSFVEDTTPEDSLPLKQTSFGYSKLMCGPPGTHTRLHRDSLHLHAWFAQIRGKTQFILYPPAATETIYGDEEQDHHSSFDPMSPDYDSYPSARAAIAHVTVLVEGETLLIPAGWWHCAITLERSITLMRSFVNSTNQVMYENALQQLQSKQLIKMRPSEDAGIAAGTAEEEVPEDDVTRDIYKRAEEYKEKGNLEFSRGRYREATEAYSKAIDCVGDEVDWQEASSKSGQIAVYHSNRAACWLKRKQWAKALEDCNQVLRSGRCDDVAVKALFRRAKSHEGLGDVDSATKDLNRVVEIQPNNRDALKELDKYRSVLHRICILGNGTQEMRAKQRGDK